MSEHFDRSIEKERVADNYHGQFETFITHLKFIWFLMKRLDVLRDGRKQERKWLIAQVGVMLLLESFCTLSNLSMQQ